MTQIIWAKPDGQIAITTLHEATDPHDEAQRLIETGLVPNDWAVNHILADGDHHVIENPMFFPALSLKDGQIVLDMDLARDVWRNKIRAARGPRFAALDIAWQRAQEAADDAALARISSEKRALRDMPAASEIARATSIADLRAFWPAILT